MIRILCGVVSRKLEEIVEKPEGVEVELIVSKSPYMPALHQSMFEE